MRCKIIDGQNRFDDNPQTFSSLWLDCFSAPVRSWQKFAFYIFRYIFILAMSVHASTYLGPGPTGQAHQAPALEAWGWREGWKQVHICRTCIMATMAIVFYIWFKGLKWGKRPTLSSPTVCWTTFWLPTDWLATRWLMPSLRLPLRSHPSIESRNITQTAMWIHPWPIVHNICHVNNKIELRYLNFEFTKW